MDSTAVPTILSDAFAALRAGEPTRVLELLSGLPAEIPPAQRGRVEAWRAQALRALGRVEEADRAVVEAIRAAKAAGDVEGVRQLRELQASVVASLAAKRHADSARAADLALLDRTDAELLAAAEGPEARADLLIRRASARMDAGRLEEAGVDIQRAGEEALAAGAPRPRVLALLAQARLARARAEDPAVAVREAHAIADASDDMNLITAVAHAARSVGVKLEAPRFG
jgi:hypothetical protein